MSRQILFSIACIFCCVALQAQRTILVITPHPDDAEASCGGLIANAVAAGDTVVILTMTGGEYGIGGVSPEQARTIRTKEAINAGAVLKARVEFFGASDAFLAVDTSSTERLTTIIQRIHPAVVLAPWPMDVHNDHQATGMLAWRVFQDKRFAFHLYFYETTNTPTTKTFGFVPTDYVDITAVESIKKKALMEHHSQHPEEWYYMYETMAQFRGYESDVKLAEAYIEAKNASGMGGRANTVSKTLQ